MQNLRVLMSFVMLKFACARSVTSPVHSVLLVEGGCTWLAKHLSPVVRSIWSSWPSCSNLAPAVSRVPKCAMAHYGTPEKIKSVKDFSGRKPQNPKTAGSSVAMRRVCSSCRVCCGCSDTLVRTDEHSNQERSQSLKQFPQISV